MHQPGYVQGGQEVGRGYLLLGIRDRRIRQASQGGKGAAGERVKKSLWTMHTYYSIQDMNNWPETRTGKYRLFLIF
jgi:hypothetical protein